jgi:type 1 glutamine amidotransferase
VTWGLAVQQFREPKKAVQVKANQVKLGRMNRILYALMVLGAGMTAAAENAKIVFLAGPPSHGPGDHEHRAGCLLLKSCLDKMPGVVSEVYSNGWPQNPEAAFAGAATVVIYSDGGGGHPFLRDNRLKTIGDLMKQGVGLVVLHYAVEPTKEKGEKEFLDWIGGCFETDWSVNPTWRAEFKVLPTHAITRGVKPFSINDEWYFHMRFREGMKGVLPILQAVAPASTMDRPDGPHEGNPAVREAVKRGEPQVMAWACERPDGGRGFGFTGGHFHHNWGNDDVRKLVLNAILWTAKVEVPAGGVEFKITEEDLRQNPDRK